MVIHWVYTIGMIVRHNINRKCIHLYVVIYTTGSILKTSFRKK